MWLGGIPTKKFHRWPRESVPSDDPYRDEHSNGIFFPGISASHDAKCAWAGMVMEECAANNMRLVFDMLVKETLVYLRWKRRLPLFLISYLLALQISCRCAYTLIEV
jgi:hypothetical protein